MTKARGLVCLILTLCLLGCSSNPTVLKLLYGQLDNVMAREILSYADFNNQQQSQIITAIDESVQWHRRESLPSYVASLAKARQRMLDQQATLADIEWLFEETITLFKEVETHSPLLKIRPLIANMSDLQVQQVTEQIDEEFKQQLKEITDQTGKDQAKASTKKLARFLRRLGLKLNALQKTKATASFARRQLTKYDRMQAWRIWADQLVLILEQRNNPDFSGNFAQHYIARMSLIERTYPAKWQADQDNLKRMWLTLFQSLTDAQRESMQERLAGLSKVALELSDT